MEVEGFPNPLEDDNDEKFPTVKTKTNKKSNGFQSMGLGHAILKGITRKGYKYPTPIQRKTIPLALEGRDIVGMARTGSGKTACFLIPLFEKLKSRQSKNGARALILSPTRELAIQTLKFIKELGQFTGLKTTVILGGDSMENQFSAIHENPDIIVATPGRFLHVCVEMDLSLKNIKYVVFDEADRLFEMGFGEQMHEITSRLPQQRQTLLFSATLPKVLVEFAKAGLTEPVLLRLDVDSKLPDELDLVFITCRPEEKLAVLLCLLKNVIKPKSQTVVFAATMHHVEYIHLILDKAHISNTFIYSNLDPTARKINTAKFRERKARVLIVTDLAARGIDIPHLDNVINFNFPAKSKLFVHRVGRCARAGRTGTAYNIVSPDEYAHLIDLHLFLGKPFNIVPPTSEDNVPKGALGKLPQSMIEEELSELINWHEDIVDIENMQNVCNNAYQKYIRSRPSPSSESVKRVKELRITTAGVLPEFRDASQSAADLISRMKNYRPPGTVFEIVSKVKSTDYKVMKAKRAYHKESIGKYHRTVEEKESQLKNEIKPEISLPRSNQDEIDEAFSEVIAPKKRKIDDLYKQERKKLRKKNERDDEFYVPYAAADKHTEDGYAVNSFAKDADKMQVDLIADNDETRNLQTQMKRWDRKKKKMVAMNDNKKVGKIRTESGVWISSSYKSDKYKQWKEKSKIDSRNDDDDDNEPSDQRLKTTGHKRWVRHNQKIKEKAERKGRNEIKTPEQVLKLRKQAENKRQKNKKKGKGRGKKR